MNTFVLVITLFGVCFAQLSNVRFSLTHGNAAGSSGSAVLEFNINQFTGPGDIVTIRFPQYSTPWTVAGGNSPTIVITGSGGAPRSLRNLSHNQQDPTIIRFELTGNYFNGYYRIEIFGVTNPSQAGSPIAPGNLRDAFHDTQVLGQTDFGGPVIEPPITSETTQETSEPLPETSEPLPETSEPETSEPLPETSEEPECTQNYQCPALSDCVNEHCACIFGASGSPDTECTCDSGKTVQWVNGVRYCIGAPQCTASWQCGNGQQCNIPAGEVVGECQQHCTANWQCPGTNRRCNLSTNTCGCICGAVGDNCECSAPSQIVFFNGEPTCVSPPPCN